VLAGKKRPAPTDPSFGACLNIVFLKSNERGKTELATSTVTTHLMEI
jgi:hypothetical protein